MGARRGGRWACATCPLITPLLAAAKDAQARKRPCGACRCRCRCRLLHKVAGLENLTVLAPGDVPDDGVSGWLMGAAVSYPGRLGCRWASAFAVPRPCSRLGVAHQLACWSSAPAAVPRRVAFHRRLQQRECLTPPHARTTFCLHAVRPWRHANQPSTAATSRLLPPPPGACRSMSPTAIKAATPPTTFARWPGALCVARCQAWRCATTPRARESPRQGPGLLVHGGGAACVCAACGAESAGGWGSWIHRALSPAGR